MARVIVTGAAGLVGRQVLPWLAGTYTDADIIALDRVSLSRLPVGIEAKRVDLASADLGGVFAGADTVIHLATVATAGSSHPAESELELALARRVLDASSEARVGHVVILSTAMVYGAWPSNPVPLTEDAPVRPNPDFAWAEQRAAIERLAFEWRQANPDAALAVLRPTALVSDDKLGQLARTLHAARAGVTADDGDPPVQYLHIDDLAKAIVTVAVERYDGVLNVAPDGWISADLLAALEGPTPRVRVPAWVAKAFAAVRWRAGLAPTPPAVVPYTTQPWVVANDRLRRLGWSAQHSNEEAWVVSHEPGPLDRMPARRRQELALVAAVVAVAALVVGAIVVVLRLRRKAAGP